MCKVQEVDRFGFSYSRLLIFQHNPCKMIIYLDGHY